MEALCQLDVQGDDMLGMLRTFLHENTDDMLTLQLAEKWTLGTWSHKLACDDLIGEAAMKWKLSRLSHVDRAILRLSVYQLRYCQDIPCKVVLNEAIEIAKKYSTEQSPRFINGVLDAVLKKLKAVAAESSSGKAEE